MTPRHVTIGNLTIGNDLPLVFIVGPNTLESRAHALEMSAALAEIARSHTGRVELLHRGDTFVQFFAIEIHAKHRKRRRRLGLRNFRSRRRRGCAGGMHV